MRPQHIGIAASSRLRETSNVRCQETFRGGGFALGLALASAACEPRSAVADREKATDSERSDATVRLSAQPGPAAETQASLMPPPSAPVPSLQVWRFEDAKFGKMVVWVRVPALPPGERVGVLFAFHGRGESLKGPERGARGWLEDYGLEHAIERLAHPPLTSEDFGGDITPERLAQHNQRLAAAPFHEPIVVMPFLPDALGRDQVFWAGPALGEWIERELVPRLLGATPALPVGAAWAIDGVSMGGRAALAIGFSKPRLFHVVGSLQAAIDEKELGRLVAWAQRARAENPAQRLRLLSSSGDYFLDVNAQLHRRLNNAGVRHEFVQVLGGHNYAFNRGPGVFEMLLDAQRVTHP